MIRCKIDIYSEQRGRINGGGRMTEQEAIELLDSFYEMDEMHDAAVEKQKAKKPKEYEWLRKRFVLKKR